MSDPNTPHLFTSRETASEAWGDFVVIGAVGDSDGLLLAFSLLAPEEEEVAVDDPAVLACDDDKEEDDAAVDDPVVLACDDNKEEEESVLESISPAVSL